MTNSSPVMDQFDRLLLQESHNFSAKTPSSSSGAPAGQGPQCQFHPLVPQRSPIDALCGVLNGNAAIRRQLMYDIVRVVLASSGISQHLVTEDDMARILEAVASELVRVPTPAEDRATISNELVWSALRDAPPGIESIHRPSADGSSHFRQVDFHGRVPQMLVTQPMPLKQKARPLHVDRPPGVAKPPMGMMASSGGSNVTRSASSAFSECSSGSLDVCSSTSLATTSKQ
jgi:hypothetical protein